MQRSIAAAREDARCELHHSIISGDWHMTRFSLFHKCVTSSFAQRGVAIAVAGLLSLTALAGAEAQTTTGSVRGYLRGEGGAPVPNGQVTARNAEMGITRAATANAE